MSPLPFDVTAGKHGGNEESRQANLLVREHKASARERIRAFVAGCGWNGATLGEIAAGVQHPLEARSYFPNEISGRITELLLLAETEPEAAVWDSGRRRDHSRVLVSNPRWVGEQK